MSSVIESGSLKTLNAGTDRYSPVTCNPMIPPIKASGMFSRIIKACRSTPNDIHSNPKTATMTIGTMMDSRFMARCWLANWPVTETLG